VREASRERSHANWIVSVIEKLRKGTVIVEGKHDVKALSELGITCFTYDFAARNIGKIARSSRVYLFFDNDKGGSQKAEKLSSLIESENKQCKVDFWTGASLLKLLNLTSIEQIVKPTEELVYRIRGDTYGEDLLRYSKIHGNSEFQH